jgi:hypothetical protein
MGGIADDVWHGLRQLASREPAASPVAAFFCDGAVIALIVDFAARESMPFRATASRG